MRGSEVKEILKSLGVSQAFVARNMDVSTQALSKMLDVDDIKVGVLDRIAKAAGKDIFFFLGDPEMIYLPKVDMKDDKLYAQMIETVNSIKNYLSIFQK